MSVCRRVEQPPRRVTRKFSREGGARRQPFNYISLPDKTPVNSKTYRFDVYTCPSVPIGVLTEKPVVWFDP